jgi:Flp pilus assembly pilin Flp
MLYNVKSLIHDETGAHFAEYGLLISLIAIVAMIAVIAFGLGVKQVLWDRIVDAVPSV